MLIGSAQSSVLDHDAAVHDDVDSGGLGAGCGFGVEDALLHPEVFEAEHQHLVHDGRDELWQTEDVDDVRLEGKLVSEG